MAISNHERVGKGLDLLKAGLGPFVERELTHVYGVDADRQAALIVGEDRVRSGLSLARWDAAALLKVMWDAWNDVFRDVLGYAERNLVSELRDVRNRWAHQQPFSGDDADRALDSMARLLTAISAPQADEVGRMKMELRRLIFDEQVRAERRKSAGATVESAAAGTLKPWREVVTPHPDVASGRYQQAEFAADLWQVHLGEGTDEYRHPTEFFRRTYLTDSLRRLLVGAAQRLTGRGGDPVVQLQTNFGGGKTHSMLALYHLFSGTPPTELPGIEPVLREAGTGDLPTARRVVLVGTKISPASPVVKPDGTTVRTLWGELAWQLGGRAAYERLRADDEHGTSPGDVLRELFNEYGPCLVLVDEWVAYARMLHDQGDLPAGSFETQFTFAQALTESARLADRCLLVVSLPASDTAGSPHTQADDVEVGGQRGREALDRLRNVIGRMESSWRPATAEEGFEIVRRRLFEPLAGPAQFKDRDVVARAFGDFYRAQQQEFPPECREADYEQRIRAAYPIHPEVFDRLYTDWSTLVKFQRTRGVLRLMAAVIHSLWESGDRAPLILPATIPINLPRVQSELTRYLSDNWLPIIEKDVDGPGSLPVRLDGDVPNLGKYAAARRVARTIYLGSAPTLGAANQGLEDRRVKLGSVLPGESPAIFGDALRRLTAAATFLYHDGTRYWYSTQPTVTRLADERAEQYRRESHKVVEELEKRLRADLRSMGDFARVHPLPSSSADVPDDVDARLVVLGVDQCYSRETGSAAELAAKGILETRGNAPRLYRNSLVFLAPDRTRLQDLDEAVRRYLAWDSILDGKVALDLTPQQVKQAETQKAAADGAIVARLPETYQWLLVPVQATPQSSTVEWQASRLAGQDALAVRASRRLRSDEHLLTALGAARLRLELDRVPLWRGDHVAIRQLADDFARYLYLPRLRDQAVLARAIQEGFGLLTWEQDSFAYAESFDEAAGRYRGLRAGQQLTVTADDSGLLVRPEAALRQLDAEARARQTELERAREAGPRWTGEGPGLERPENGEGLAGGSRWPEPNGSPARAEEGAGPRAPVAAPKPRRFYGTVELSAERAGRDAGRVAEEVIAHLAGVVGARVKVTLEIEADLPDDAPDTLVRTVTENSHALKFTTASFERE